MRINGALLSATCSAALISVAAAQPNSIWDHNGSAMVLVDEGPGFGIYYQHVRPGLGRTTPPGAPRFRGRRIGDRIVGEAFVHTKYCPGQSFPYRVSGVVHDPAVIELYGPAAVVDPNTCTIVGFKPDSDNAHVVFRLIEPLAMAPPPAVVAPSGIVVNTPVTINNPPPSVIVVNPPAPAPVAPVPLVQADPQAVEPYAPAPAQPMGRIERREDLKRQGREFCREFPTDKVCNPGEPPRRR